MQVNFYYDVAAHKGIFNTTAAVVAVVGFERGYHPCETRASAARLNTIRKPSAEELESALLASCFGWDCPAAIPARRFVEALERAHEPLAVQA